MRRSDYWLTVRAARGAIRCWQDCRALACLLEAKREGRARPRKIGRGKSGGPALALRAFSNLRQSLLEMLRQEGVPWEEVERVLAPNLSQDLEARARRRERQEREKLGAQAQAAGTQEAAAAGSSSSSTGTGPRRAPRPRGPVKVRPIH